MSIIGEIVVGDLLCRLRNDEVGERLTHDENRLLFGQLQLIVGLDGGIASTVQTPLAFVAALEEAGELGGVGVGVVHRSGFGDFGRGEGEVRIGPNAGLDLLRLDREEVLLRSEQGRIPGQGEVDGLLHGEWKRRSNWRRRRRRQVLGEDA